MILSRVQVHGFRSIQSRLDNFWLNEHLTILVGANEHGKTNLLDAISFLGKDSFTSDDKCRSKNFKPGAEKVPEIKFTLTLSTADKKALEGHLLETKDKLPTEMNADDKAHSEKLQKILADLLSQDLPQIEISVHEGYQKAFFYVFKKGEKLLINAASSHPLSATTVAFIRGLLPTVVTFGPSVDFSNSTTIAELNSRSSKEWEGLLKLGDGVWEDREKLFQNNLDGRDFREESRAKIQRKLRNIWSQGKQEEADLKIDFELDATSGKLYLDFIDRTGTRNQPSHRSLGFKSFFSFYLRLYAETTEIDPNGYIFAFDEPGLHLHPSGQKDLLREIRKISEKNQIVFSTHSPFLIDRHTSTKVVVVSKDQEGTKLDQKPYRKNWAPLRSSLGLVMNDTFFYANKTLLVEGTSDRMFLSTLLHKFSEELEIDINFLSIIDGDDRNNLPAMVRILLAEDRELVLLTDKDEGGKVLIDQVVALAKSMHKSSLLKTQHYGDFIVQEGDISVEDILPAVPLESAIKKYMKDVLKINETFSLADIQRTNLSLGKSLSNFFLEKGWATANSSFSKTTVADFFSQVVLDYKDEIEDSHPSKVVSKKLKELLGLS